MALNNETCIASQASQELASCTPSSVAGPCQRSTAGLAAAVGSDLLPLTGVPSRQRPLLRRATGPSLAFLCSQLPETALRQVHRLVRRADNGLRRLGHACKNLNMVALSPSPITSYRSQTTHPISNQRR